MFNKFMTTQKISALLKMYGEEVDVYKTGNRFVKWVPVV